MRSVVVIVVVVVIIICGKIKTNKKKYKTLAVILKAKGRV